MHIGSKSFKLDGMNAAKNSKSGLKYKFIWLCMWDQIYDKGLIYTYNFSTLKVYNMACVPSTAVNFIATLTYHCAYKKKKLAE